MMGPSLTNEEIAQLRPGDLVFVVCGNCFKQGEYRRECANQFQPGPLEVAEVVGGGIGIPDYWIKFHMEEGLAPYGCTGHLYHLASTVDEGPEVEIEYYGQR